jgi:phage major head subunit gpT-like protein
VPTRCSYFSAAVAAITTTALQRTSTNLIKGITIDIQMNARLTWTDTIAIFRTDSPIKAFIRQTEQEIELKVKAEGSEFEFDNDAWQFGIDGWRGTGYGYWQRACMVTML